MPAKKVAKSKRRVPITITLDPKTVRWLREAAKRGNLSISRYVESLLSVV